MSVNLPEKKKIKVLLVDDSAVMRLVITSLLTKDEQIQIVGTAAYAEAAYEKIEQLSPDLVTLDIEMPNVDGISALKVIKKKHPDLPVIMCSTLTQNGAHATIESLSAGADDYVCKPSTSESQSKEQAHEAFRKELTYKIRQLTKRNFLKQFSEPQQPILSKPKTTDYERVDVVTIGTSTGGPTALRQVLTSIPANFPVPILIVQHMPPLFTKILAESLEKNLAIPVMEASDGTIIEAGQAYIAPGNYHMTLNYKNNRYQLELNQEPEVNFCRPSVDVLFDSVAKAYGKHVLAVIMTGMGHDGLDGCQEIRNKGGSVLAQDEASSVVWGMPGAVSNAGLADQILPLNEIGSAIIQQVKNKRE